MSKSSIHPSLNNTTALVPAGSTALASSQEGGTFNWIGKIGGKRIETLLRDILQDPGFVMKGTSIPGLPASVQDAAKEENAALILQSALSIPEHDRSDRLKRKIARLEEFLLRMADDISHVAGLSQEDGRSTVGLIALESGRRAINDGGHAGPSGNAIG